MELQDIKTKINDIVERSHFHHDLDENIKTNYSEIIKKHTQLNRDVKNEIYKKVNKILLTQTATKILTNLTKLEDNKTNLLKVYNTINASLTNKMKVDIEQIKKDEKTVIDEAIDNAIKKQEEDNFNKMWDLVDLTDPKVRDELKQNNTILYKNQYFYRYVQSGQPSPTGNLIDVRENKNKERCFMGICIGLLL